MLHKCSANAQNRQICSIAIHRQGKNRHICECVKFTTNVAKYPSQAQDVVHIIGQTTRYSAGVTKNEAIKSTMETARGAQEAQEVTQETAG